MRILVIKLSSFGDLFHALPAVHNLKAMLGADVDWVTQTEYVDLVKCFRPVDRVIPFHRRDFWAHAVELRASLKESTYDYVFDFQGLLKSAIVAFLAGGKIRIGPSHAREGASLFYDAVAGSRNKQRHAVDECLDVVRYLGMRVLPVEFPMKFPAIPVTGKGPHIALLPVSRWPTKTWPADRFAEVARRLKTDTGGTVYLMGGPDDASVCESIVARLGDGVVNLAGKTSLPETGSWMQEMDLLVSNDSGPVHLAAALGVPALVVFGPTDPRRTGPFGAAHRVVNTRIPCQPCLSRSCKFETVRCMEGVSVDAVVQEARWMLQG